MKVFLLLVKILHFGGEARHLNYLSRGGACEPVVVSLTGV
jgi:hypothetical protein